MATTNTSTPSPEAQLDQALASITEGKLRAKLIQTYLALKRNFAEGRFDQAGIDASKFCEVSIRVAQWRVKGSFTPLGTHIPNFADEVRALVTSPKAAAHESIREIIPRALLFIYTLRNKRGIGHVGGDVDANRVDATAVLHSADWVMCELIRLYHGLPLEEAQDLVDNLAQRRVPAVWDVAGRKRVLTSGLTAADETLVLLYGERDSAVLAEDLCEWVEYSELRHYRTKVLAKLHDGRLVEYDRENDVVHLSPKGVSYVEDRLLSVFK